MTDDAEPKVRIYVNSNSSMSRGKYAAAAVHAALMAAGVHPGMPVIVLGAQRDHVVRCETVIRDAGLTEVDPGTPTAGTDWQPRTRTARRADTRVVYWLDCDCEVRTKYCDENHTRSARVPLEFLRDAAGTQ